MSVPVPDGLTQRVRQLERELRRLAVDVQRANELPRHQPAPTVFLVRTRGDNSLEYPQAPANTYHIEYIDAPFTETAGDQAVTIETRDDESQGVAHDLAPDRYLPESTACLVIHALNGQRYVLPLSNTEFKSLVRFTLGDALTDQDDSQSATITDQYGPGIENPDDEITVHNLEQPTEDTYYFTGTAGAVGLAIHDSGQNYRIIMMCEIKPLARFTLSGTLTKSTASQSATITDQYGDGIEGETSITVHNLNIGGSYLFEGQNGAVGYAYRDVGTDYRILAMAPAPGDQDDEDTGLVTVKGYLAGALLSSEAFKSMEVTEVCGKGIEVGSYINARNPTSRITGTGVFAGARNAWCKATRNNLGEFGFDVMECTGEVEQEYVPQQVLNDNERRGPNNPAQDVAGAAPGAFGGPAVDDGEGDVFEFLALSVRDRAAVLGGGDFGYKLELRRQARQLRGMQRTAHRAGAAHAAGRRYTNGMLNTWNYNLAMQALIHRQIHLQWTSYYVGVNQLIGVLARRGPASHPAFRG